MRRTVFVIINEYGQAMEIVDTEDDAKYMIGAASSISNGSFTYYEKDVYAPLAELKAATQIDTIAKMVFEKPEEYNMWINTPSPEFDGKTPNEVMDKGGFEDVLTVISTWVK